MYSMSTCSCQKDEELNFVNNQSRGNFFSSPFKSNVSNAGIQGWKNPQGQNPQGQNQTNWKNSTNSSNRVPFVPLVERTIKLEET